MIYVRTGVSLDEVGHVFVLGLHHAAAGGGADRDRVGDLGAGGRADRPASGARRKVQPIAQFLAAFPANLLFPVFVIAIVRFHLNPDIWLSPLIVLGTQWYILFNVIAGATSYPNDYREAAKNFHIRGWQWWRRRCCRAFSRTT